MNETKDLNKYFSRALNRQFIYGLSIASILGTFAVYGGLNIGSYQLTNYYLNQKKMSEEQFEQHLEQRVSKMPYFLKAVKSLASPGIEEALSQHEDNKIVE